MDNFELAPALADLLSRPVSTTLLHALIHKYDTQAKGALDMAEFLSLVQGGPDGGWAKADQYHLAPLEDGLYEVLFAKPSLGFRVKNDQAFPGCVIVSSILDPDNEGRMHLGDTVCAVS